MIANRAAGIQNAAGAECDQGSMMAYRSQWLSPSAPFRGLQKAKEIAA
jgi:hypothetical protein